MEKKIKLMEKTMGELKTGHTKKANYLMDKFTRDVAKIHRETNERHRLTGVFSNQSAQDFNEEV